jgi:hypothetical protein
MTSRERRHTVASLALVLAATTTVSACGAGEAEEPAAQESSSTSSPSPEPTTSAPVPEPEPEPTVEPADGPWLSTKYARFRMPKGWKRVNDVGFSSIAQGDGPGARGTIHFSIYPAEGQTSLDQAARFTVKDVRDRLKSGALKRADDVVIGGDTMAFHLTGHQLFWDVDAYGVLRSGARFVVLFSLDERKPPEENQALIDSMLQTFEFTL